ncbi:MAG: membrane protein [Candidatus Syntrophoarchaeum caldarius]|uniref:Membrane protein n=1 Tax=Candidatus Syntropharchaeum caldarium TaxID=1838285 RepID=A0A1F2P9K9_9EURY|nr:MAG: membrane protein [Candidatus Syntrophoarchaeum caldarius]
MNEIVTFVVLQEVMNGLTFVTVMLAGSLALMAAMLATITYSVLKGGTIAWMYLMLGFWMFLVSFILRLFGDAWVTMGIATDISYLFGLAMMIAGFKELSGIYVDYQQT